MIKEKTLLENNLFYLGLSLIKLKNHKSAQEIFKELISSRPRRDLIKQAYYYLGICFKNTNKFKNAIKYLKMVSTGDKKNIEIEIKAEFETAVCMEKLGKTDDAITEYLRIFYFHSQYKDWVIKAAGATTNLLIKKAEAATDLLIKKENFEEAEKLCLKIIEFGPDKLSAEHARTKIKKIKESLAKIKKIKESLKSAQESL